jgi:outer membrane protein
MMRNLFKPYFVLLTLLLAQLALMFSVSAAEKIPSTDTLKAGKQLVDKQVDNRLEMDEQLLLENYSLVKPEPLGDTAAEYQQLRSGTNKKKLNLNLEKALPNLNGTFSISERESTNNANLLSIADVRVRALRNNLSIKVAKVDPLIAHTSTREEEAKFDNIIFAYAKYNALDTPQISGDNVVLTSNSVLNNEKLKLSTLEQRNRNTQLDAGIKIPLRSGGTVILSSPLQKKVNSALFDSNEYNSALTFSISQPLLRNAGRNVNEASIRIAEYSARATELNTRLQSIRIIAMVDKAYWALYQAWGDLDVRRQQYELASQNLEMVGTRVKEGLSAAVETNRAEIGVADRLDALIMAETNVKLAQRQLHMLMNDLPDTGTSFIAPSSEPTLLKYEFNRPKLLQDALAGRLEILEQEVKLAADQAKIGYLENQTLPLFMLDYQYGALSNTQNSFNNIYQNLFNGQFSDWSIGLKFEMPLNNGVRKEQLERAVLQRNQRLATKEMQELTVKKEIFDALDFVDQNWQRILAARQQVLVAGFNYQAELKQFNEGLRTMTEVLETLTRLGDAQLKELRAVTEYQVALIDTAYATGTLLGYSKLDFN